MPEDTENAILDLVRELADVRGKMELLTTAHYNEVQVTSDLRIRVASLVDRLESQDRAAQVRADALARLARVAENAFDWLTARPDPAQPERSRVQEILRLGVAMVGSGGTIGTLVELSHRWGWF